MMKKERLNLLDELRGFAVFCMVFYHGFYTFSYIFPWKPAEILLDFFTPAVPWFAGGFILISGISSRLSHSNLRRGLLLAAVALGVSFVTFLLTFFNINEQIYFGILHMMSVSILFFAVFKRLLDKIPAAFAVTLLLMAFIFTYNIGEGYVGLSFFRLQIPEIFTNSRILYPIGIHHADFASSDYFPIFPWLFLFLTGTYLGKYVYSEKLSKVLTPSRIPPLAFLGRIALWVYIFHQPVIFLLGNSFSYLLK